MPRVAWTSTKRMVAGWTIIQQQESFELYTCKICSAPCHGGLYGPSRFMLLIFRPHTSSRQLLIRPVHSNTSMLPSGLISWSCCCTSCHVDLHCWPALMIETAIKPCDLLLLWPQQGKQRRHRASTIDRPHSGHMRVRIMRLYVQGL